MRISVVTPTKDRPEAVELCQRWFRQQTVQAHEHLIIDGGTHVENLLEGIERASGDVIVFADDDDYYGPGWLAWIDRALRVRSLAGQVITQSFHIRDQARQECKVGPLAGTMAFRRCESRAVIDHITARQTPKHILWDYTEPKRVPSSHAKITTTQHVTHIKGLYPNGISVQHTSTKHPIPDPGLAYLRATIGDPVVGLYLDAIPWIDRGVRWA